MDINSVADMDILANILPSELSLSKSNEDRNVVHILNRDGYRIGSIKFFNGGLSAQVFACHDLFLLFPIELPNQIYNTSIPPLCRLPSNLVPDWWNSVLNAPLTLGLENEFHIKTDRLMGVGLRFRGVFLSVTVWSIESSPAKPVWKRIREQHPNLRSSLSDSSPHRAMKRPTRIKLVGIDGWNNDEIGGIADVGDKWVSFVSCKGGTPQILPGAEFPKNNYPSYRHFIELMGKWMPDTITLLIPIEVNSLRFEDLLPVCKERFPTFKA
jgi:hypothetical protein